MCLMCPGPPHTSLRPGVDDSLMQQYCLTGLLEQLHGHQNCFHTQLLTYPSPSLSHHHFTVGFCFHLLIAVQAAESCLAAVVHGG